VRTFEKTESAAFFSRIVIVFLVYNGRHAPHRPGTGGG